jgi:hypothetical protein
MVLDGAQLKGHRTVERTQAKGSSQSAWPRCGRHMRRME